MIGVIAMTATTLSSREFNQNASEAKKAANDGPVFITDRGKPAHVLLSIEDYRRLVGAGMNLAQAIAQDDAPDVDFEPARLGQIAQPVEFD